MFCFYFVFIILFWVIRLWFLWLNRSEECERKTKKVLYTKILWSIRYGRREHDGSSVHVIVVYVNPPFPSRDQPSYRDVSEQVLNLMMGEVSLPETSLSNRLGKWSGVVASTSASTLSFPTFLNCINVFDRLYPVQQFADGCFPKCETRWLLSVWQ